MGNCLVMLTSAFPYMFTEPFLETEIWFHEKNYDKIIILAIDIEPNSPKCRDVPENTDIYNVAKRGQKLSRIGDVLRGTAAVPFKRTYRDEAVGGNISKRIFMQYFTARAERLYRQCAEILKKYDFSVYDNVAVYSYWLFVAAMTGTLLKNDIKKQCPNTRMISRAHRYDLYEDRNKLNYLPMRRYLLENIDAVYPCSEDGEAYLKTKYPEFSDKIKCSYLGTFDKGIAEGSEKGFHIVSCSRATDVKRIERIVDALSELGDLKNIKWTHIGDGEKLPEIKDAAEEKLGFMEYSLDGARSNAEVYEFYKKNKVDLFVNVSSSEGLPVSIMEAISFGIPVVATDVGGTGEIVRDGFNGFLIKENFTDKELAEKIRFIYKADAAEIKKLRENARGLWQENFDANKNYTAFAKEIKV